MDSITQIALGAAVAEKIAGKKLGNKALLYGAIIGTIPDLDVLVGKFLDPIDAIEIHRGFSHSILFFLISTPLFASIIYRLERRNFLSYSRALHMVFWTLLTHALLDAFTSWGTHLLWPIDYKIDFKTIFVVDPLYTIPLIIGIIMAARFPKIAPSRQKWITRGLYFSTAYLALTVATKLYMLGHFKDELKKNQIAYQQLMVKPSPMNILLWNANISTENGYYLGDYSVFDKSPTTFRFIEKNEHLLQGIKEEHKVQQLIKISEGWYTIDTLDNKWIFNDLRFGLLHPYSHQGENSFVFSYEIWNKNGIIKADEVKNKDRRSGAILLQQLFERIKGI